MRKHIQKGSLFITYEGKEPPTENDIKILKNFIKDIRNKKKHVQMGNTQKNKCN